MENTVSFLFQILSEDNSILVGRLSKEWGGVVKETFTNASNYNLYFPMDLDARCKALLLGATLLIDFMFFEDNRDNDGKTDTTGKKQ